MANWKCAFDLNVAALWRCYWLQHAHQNFLWNKVVPPEKEGDFWAHIFSCLTFSFLSLTQPPQPDYNFNLNFKWAKHCLFGIFFLCVCCFVCLTVCGLVLRFLSPVFSPKMDAIFSPAFWSGDGCATATTMANISREDEEEGKALPLILNLGLWLCAAIDQRLSVLSLSLSPSRDCCNSFLVSLLSWPLVTLMLLFLFDTGCSRIITIIILTS